MPGRIEECLETTDASHIQKRSDDVRFALLLTYITLGWMTIEGAASLLLGWASKSLLLEAFGIDSVIELFSAAVLVPDRVCSKYLCSIRCLELGVLSLPLRPSDPFPS